MKAQLLLATVILLGAHARAEEPTAQVARLTDSNALVEPSSTSTLKLATCQPLRSEAVAILEWAEVFKAPAARVRVLEGHCKDAEGWIGTAHLEIPH